jgi:acetolactate synthase-1/2/3 large subunit
MKASTPRTGPLSPREELDVRKGTDDMSSRRGGHLVAEALALHGTRIVFTVPGNSLLATLDGLRDHPAVRVVVCRHEGGAAYMAEASGRLTREPGVCLVTRGPGATNASIGVATAREEGTPLLLLVGDVGSEGTGRDAFQEIDTLAMFQPLAKWVMRVPTVERIPELLSRAFHIATSGRPGPVVLVLPEDVQLAEASVKPGRAYQRVEARAGASDLESLRARLAQARHPLLILGGSGWTAKASKDVQAFAEAFQLPVAVTFRRQDVFDNEHANYVGTLGVGTDAALSRRVAEADLLLLVGGQLGEVETAGYRILSVPQPSQELVHVAPSAEELGKIYRPDLSIVSSVEAFASAARALDPPDVHRRDNDLGEGRKAFEAFTSPGTSRDALNLAEVISQLAGVVPRDAVIAVGAGNYTHWVLRYHRYRLPGTLLAPIGAPMGYSVPAAVAAGLVCPEREIVAFAGDGCFLMNGQELATAVQYGVRASFFVVNNRMLASVRMRQERLFPGRVIATDLENPSFTNLAKAYGVPAVTVTRTKAFADAFRALREESDGPILLELVTNPDTISPDATIDQLREAARRR